MSKIYHYLIIFLLLCIVGYTLNDSEEIKDIVDKNLFDVEHMIRSAIEKIT